METSTVFNYQICRYHLEDTGVFRNQDLISNTESIFNNSDLDDNLNNQIKKGISTFGLEKYQLLKTVGIESLITWIKSKILESSTIFGYAGATDIEFKKSFTNKMWTGSSGKIHNHTNDNHGVAVFYFQQPINGSDLVLVRNSFIGDDLTSVTEENKHHLKVRQGDLILHETSAWHGVSLHNGDTPRIVFVFEYRYII